MNLDFSFVFASPVVRWMLGEDRILFLQVR